MSVYFINKNQYKINIDIIKDILSNCKFITESTKIDNYSNKPIYTELIFTCRDSYFNNIRINVSILKDYIVLNSGKGWFDFKSELNLKNRLKKYEK